MKLELCDEGVESGDLPLKKHDWRHNSYGTGISTEEVLKIPRFKANI